MLAALCLSRPLRGVNGRQGLFVLVVPRAVVTRVARRRRCTSRRKRVTEGLQRLLPAMYDTAVVPHRAVHWYAYP